MFLGYGDIAFGPADPDSTESRRQQVDVNSHWREPGGEGRLHHCPRSPDVPGEQSILKPSGPIDVAAPRRLRRNGQESFEVTRKHPPFDSHLGGGKSSEADVSVCRHVVDAESLGTFLQ